MVYCGVPCAVFADVFCGWLCVFESFWVCLQIEEPDELGSEYVRISAAKGTHLRRIKALKEASSIELDVTTVEHRCKRCGAHTKHTLLSTRTKHTNTQCS